MKTPTHVWRENSYSRGCRVEKVPVFGTVIVDDEVIGYVEEGGFGDEDAVSIIDANHCWLTKKEALAAIPKRHGGKKKSLSMCYLTSEKILKEIYAGMILASVDAKSAVSEFAKGKAPEGKVWTIPFKTEVAK